MADYETIDLRVQFRAGHSTIWELADKAGVLAQLNTRLASLAFCESSSKAEAALFDGRVDVVAGNHISPYAKVAQGKPIVCLASPGNWGREESQVRTRPIPRCMRVLLHSSAIHRADDHELPADELGNRRGVLGPAAVVILRRER
ncbi:MAG: hypothetical protein GEU73_16095 [Chloroflexi bacterium]|nr:hypothetical protein [Chloroflexota bacterium]